MVITGNGKGKTTAALGIALRAAGHGMKSCIIQFIKGDMFSGEMESIKQLEPYVELHVGGKGFCGIMGDTRSFDEHKSSAQRAIALAMEKMLSGNFHIIILDEINNAVHMGLVDISQVLTLIDKKPPLLHLILTGRNAHPEIIDKAHTVTEMKEIKHAFHAGIEPQPGIDF